MDSTGCAASPRWPCSASTSGSTSFPTRVEVSRDNFGEFLLFESRVAFVMFFVLSGYLLYRPFARAALGEAKPVSIASYFVRRVARIMPAYYLALAGAVALVATAGDVPGRRAVERGELPLFLVFAQNYTPDTLLKLNAATWTLAIEVAFYVLLPLVALFALKRCYGSVRGQVALIASLVTVGLAWNLVDWAAGWGPVASHSPPSFLPYFACGMLVALAVEAIRSGRLRAAREPSNVRRWWRGRSRCWSPTATGTRATARPTAS